MYQKHQNFFQQQDNSTSLGFIRPNQQNLIIGPDALQNDYPIQQQLVGLLIRARRTKLGQCSLSLLCSQQAIAQERNLPCGAHLKGSVYRSLVIKKKKNTQYTQQLKSQTTKFQKLPYFLLATNTSLSHRTCLVQSHRSRILPCAHPKGKQLQIPSSSKEEYSIHIAA